MLSWVAKTQHLLNSKKFMYEKNQYFQWRSALLKHQKTRELWMLSVGIKRKHA